MDVHPVSDHGSTHQNNEIRIALLEIKKCKERCSPTKATCSSTFVVELFSLEGWYFCPTEKAVGRDREENYCSLPIAERLERAHIARLHLGERGLAQ